MLVMAISEAWSLLAEASSGGQADMPAVQLGSQFLADETKACPKPTSVSVLPVPVEKVVSGKVRMSKGS